MRRRSASDSTSIDLFYRNFFDEAVDTWKEHSVGQNAPFAQTESE